jgi:hypothetical protein
MRVSFSVGLEQNRPWTLCVDADLLLRPGSIQRMIELAEAQPENVCEIQGYVLDKFFGGPRIGGVHLYRTSLLELVIAAIPKDGEAIRPERHALGVMRDNGFPWKVVPYLVGFHDEEQYFRDVYRKAFVQAHKHDYLCDLFLTHWRAQMTADVDFAVALAGFAGGMMHRGKVLIDVRQKLFSDGLMRLGLEEKQPLAGNAWTLDQVEERISAWREPAIYHRKFPRRGGLDAATDAKKRRSARLASDDGTGSARILARFVDLAFRFIAMLGRGLVRIGRWTLSLVEPT